MFDFPLTVKAIDDVPEQFRSIYEQGDDGFRMVDGLAKKAHDLGSLQTTLQKFRKDQAVLDKTLKGFTQIAETPEKLTEMIAGYRELGESPEKVRQLIEEKDRLLADKGDVGKQIDQIKRAHEAELGKVRDAHTKALSEREEHVKGLRSAMEREMIDSALTSEIVKAKGAAELLLPIARQHVRVVQDPNTGEYVRRVVDGDGDTRINGKGEPMSIGELIQEMRASDVYARAFDAEGRGGSGGGGSNGAGGNRAGKSYSRSEWIDLTGRATPEERARLLRERAAGRIRVT